MSSSEPQVPGETADPTASVDTPPVVGESTGAETSPVESAVADAADQTPPAEAETLPSSATGSVAAEPVAGESGAAEPVADESVVAEPVADESAVTEAPAPASTDPVAAEPAIGEPGAEEPAPESGAEVAPAEPSAVEAPDVEAPAMESSVPEPNAVEAPVVEAPAAEPAAAEAPAAEPSVAMTPPVEKPVATPAIGDSKPDASGATSAGGEANNAPASADEASPSTDASTTGDSSTVGESSTVGDSSAVGDSSTDDDGKPKRDTTRVLGGIITAITSDEVDLTLDDGRPAVISRRNFDADGTDPSTVFNPGDRVEGALLTREDPKNRVVLSRAWALKRQAWEAVAALAEKNELVSAKATGKSKKGLVVDVQGVRGFVPTSHLELEQPTNLASYVGQTLELKILDCDVAKERLVLSRRSQLLKEQRKAISGLLNSLVVGETRTGKVASLADYGAFVDIGGATGLVHLSELSWSRVRHPRDVVSVGDEIEVKILDVKIKKKRISLSHRQVSADPFDAVPVGEIVVGTVTRLVDFGAFVDVGGGLEGLVHITELAEFRVFAPEEIVTPGEEVRVKVLSIDRKRRRVELSIRQAAIL